MKNRILLFFTIFVLLSIQGICQSEMTERRIYVVDVTASMVGKGSVKTPMIFPEVKKRLISAVNQTSNEKTEFVIIPFTDHVFPKAEFSFSEKSDLCKYISNLSIKPGETNIDDAWLAGVNELDSSKINYLFLLTDGLHNHGVDNDTFLDHFSTWSKKSKGLYWFSFYVALTPNASSTDIAHIVNQAKQMWLIESMNVNISFVNSKLNVIKNFYEDNNVELTFSSNNNEVFNRDIHFDLTLQDNPYYEIDSLSFDFSNRRAFINLINKVELDRIPQEFITSLVFRLDHEKYPMVYFTPEEIELTIYSVPVSNQFSNTGHSFWWWILLLIRLLLAILLLLLIIKLLKTLIPILTYKPSYHLKLWDVFKIRWGMGYSNKVLPFIRSIEEAKIYQKAGLIEATVGGKTALIQPKLNKDLQLRPGVTNLSDMQAGYAAQYVDENGELWQFELHHIGQDPNSPLAELTWSQHHGDGNFHTLHTFGESKIDRAAFENERIQYWINRANMFNK